MSRRENSLIAYVSEDLKREVKQRADDEDETVSEYLNRIIRRQLQMEAEDALASEVHAEERIRELTTIAVDEIRETATEMRELNAKTGAYAAANFELLKGDYKDATRRDALATGSRRMRTDLDAVQDQLGGAAESDGAPPEPAGEESASDDGDTDCKGPFERMQEDDDVRE